MSETISDIVAQIRAAAYIQNADTPQSVLRLADRIEAAAKREMSKIASKNGADFWTICNAAKLREALERARHVL